MEKSACEAARAALNSKLPGAATSATDSTEGMNAADLKAKLEAMQEASKQLQAESGHADGAVNSETLAALKSTQAELRETKTRLETARTALELKEKEMATKADDQNARIIELEQQLTIQTKAAQDGSKASDSAAAAATKALNEKLKKITAEMEGWKQKAEAAEKTASRLKAAAAEGDGNGGGAVVAEITEENEKLKAQVEKLTANVSSYCRVVFAYLNPPIISPCPLAMQLVGQNGDGKAAGTNEGGKNSLDCNGENEKAA